MNFSQQLRAASGTMTAREIALAISPIISVRVVEGWQQGRTSPPAWVRDWILEQVRKAKP